MFRLLSFNKYGIYCVAGIVTWFGSVAGTLAWFVHYIASLANNPSLQQVISPIDLAGVTATLGGLILIGAFYKEKGANGNEKERDLTEALKLVGKLILVSSVCFIIGYFLIEYVRLITTPTLSFVNWLFVIATDLVMIIAGFAVSFALSLLVTIVRYI
jgi:hypothetical protein